ncbi:hypothetical protein IEQ34_001681 [Dendrobium chrysotoxum]|uniref:Uncharacterized protein n=1 Tax=Dendrobium chrysotoxum TaxID=161865 RepID=A0AAV7HR99_DENCH|nr:hypothetical protein IEQ34_001681 [Dendrobium chrysotoxum]
MAAMPTKLAPTNEAALFNLDDSLSMGRYSLAGAPIEAASLSSTISAAEGLSLEGTAAYGVRKELDGLGEANGASEAMVIVIGRARRTKSMASFAILVDGVGATRCFCKEDEGL